MYCLDAKATPTEEPAEPTPTTRPALTPPVTDSKVTGLEEPLAFYPKTMYNFKVVGAGTENTDPVNGDTKWIPYGWSVNKDNIRSGYEKSFSIGNKYGIKDAKPLPCISSSRSTYTMDPNGKLPA